MAPGSYGPNGSYGSSIAFRSYSSSSITIHQSVGPLGYSIIFYPSLSVLVCPSIKSVNLSIHPPVHPSIDLFIYLSMYLLYLIRSCHTRAHNHRVQLTKSSLISTVSFSVIALQLKGPDKGALSRNVPAATATCPLKQLDMQWSSDLH